MGWGGNRIRREIEWIRDGMYSNLKKDEQELMKKFRSVLRYRNQHEETIQSLREEIKTRQEKMSGYDENLTYLYHEIKPIIDKHYFSISFTSFKKGVNNTEYFNLIVNRPGRVPKSVGLGTEEIIREHLLRHSPKDEDKIMGDKWKSYIQYEVNFGKTYQRIGKLILRLNHEEYRDLKLSRDKVFPIK